MTRIIIIITAVIAAAALIYTGSVLLGSNTEPTPPLPTQEQVDALIDWEDLSRPSEYHNEGFFVRTCPECGKNAMLGKFFTYPDNVSFCGYKCYACGLDHGEQHGSIEPGPHLDDLYPYCVHEAADQIDTMRVWLAPYLVPENPVVQDMIMRGEQAPRYRRYDGSLESDPDLAGTPIEHFI